ncbi:MAG: phycobilisome rod-core linker polypeptide [Cyanobacteria bacterium P01_D01_bin.105]
MTLSALTYAPTSQNQRVPDYAVGNDEQPRIYDNETLLSTGEKDDAIQAAYRQIFHEQQMLESYRQPFLESQFRAGQITTRDLIQGLVCSDAFKRLNFESNNNYRFVEICIQRILGREVFSEREKISWSIVVATQGMKAFVNELLSSEEYELSFGDSVVPYQRSRILPKQAQGRLPFARTARYDLRDRPDLASSNILGSAIDLGDIGPNLLSSLLGLLIVTALIIVTSAAANF